MLPIINGVLCSLDGRMDRVVIAVSGCNMPAFQGHTNSLAQSLSFLLT